MIEKEKLEALKKYCPGDFAESVCSQYEQRGGLTLKQWSTVDRLISNGVRDDDYRDDAWGLFGDDHQ